MVMKRVRSPKQPTEVGVADLKAHLSAYLRVVRSGTTLTLMDRKTAIARLTPIGASPSKLPHTPATGLLQDFRPPRRPADQGRDVLLDLLDERQRER